MKVATFTSQLPLTLSATTCNPVIPSTRYILAEKMGTVWVIGEVRGGVGLGGAGVAKIFVGKAKRFLASPCILANYAQVVVEQVAELDSTPAGLGEGVTIPRTSSLQIRNSYFSDGSGGKIFIPIFMANSTGYIYTEETPVSFLGETWNKTTVKCRNTPLSLPFESNKKYFGAGMVSGSYPLVFAGKTGMPLEAGRWAIAETSAVGGVIKSYAPSGTTWTLANFKVWDEEEPPVFCKVVSDESSGEIYRFVLPTTPQPELVYKITLRKTERVRVLRYRSTATLPTVVEDGGITPVTLPSTPNNNWQWVGYTPLSHSITFRFGANGIIDIDMEVLKRSFFPNWERVESLARSLPAFVSLQPDFTYLPTSEGYFIYLNGNLSDLQASISKGQFLRKTLQREGISVELRLSPSCIPSAFIRKALAEIAGGLTPISVFQSGNAIWVVLACAMSANEALVLAHLHALKDTILGVCKALIPEWAEGGVNINVAILHRGSHIVT